jgi:hypothetical protein
MQSLSMKWLQLLLLRAVYVCLEGIEPLAGPAAMLSLANI